jgi:ketosteroid isomerase-like protein
MGAPHEVAQRVFDAVNVHDLTVLGGLYAPEARTLRPGEGRTRWTHPDPGPG